VNTEIIMIIKKIKNLIFNLRKLPYFGFIQGHDHLTDGQLSYLKSVVGVVDVNIVGQYERKFSKLVGPGHCISFASARMGFWALLKYKGVGKGDEVILNGGTCAVMANAILRTGATIVYSDISPDTFGSSADQIKRKITTKTKIIVAQHSFGIPCKIDVIADLAKGKNIFLIEDSALAVGSTLKGKLVGSFGDASIFSTDHSKPINTFLGGMVYSENTKIIKAIKSIKNNAEEVSVKKQNVEWKRILIERKYYGPSFYGKLQLFNLLGQLRGIFLKEESAFLDKDFYAEIINQYPYPAKMPTFLAALGLIELENWELKVMLRKRYLTSFLDLFDAMGINSVLPTCYKDKDLDIIPLRFVWSKDDDKLKKELDRFLDVNGFWFQAPIIATPCSLDQFGYKGGDCPISEKLGRNMFNLPTALSNDDFTLFYKMIEKALGDHSSNHKS